MFVIPCIAVILTYVYVRPQEILEPLRTLGFSTVLLVVMFGYLLDVRIGVTRRPRPTLLLTLGIAFFLWALVTIAASEPETLPENLLYFAGLAAMFFTLSQGLQSVRGFWAVARILLVVTLFLAGVAIHQGMSPKICMIDQPQISTTPTTAVEGTEVRLCAARADCVDGGIPGVDYSCEHAGLFGTFSDGGRVRYRGIFQDPNDLAWVMSLSLPFAFGWFSERKTTGPRLLPRLLPVAALVLCIACNVMTRSRSGQISLVATLGVYFARRFGWRGVAIGGMLALPVLLLGGRSDEASTQERLECWAEALSLWREHPLLGVGAKQFTKHHYLTAHNSFLLALADMGPLGLLLWTWIVALAFKTVVQVQRDFADRPEAESARTAALALLASLTGTVVSALFLSITYHMSLWILLGLVGAIQAAVTRHDPGWRVRWRLRDTMYVVGFDVAIVSSIALYLRLKGV